MRQKYLLTIVAYSKADSFLYRDKPGEPQLYEKSGKPLQNINLSENCLILDNIEGESYL